MPDVKSLGQLPRGETNGLSAIAGELADEAMGRKPKRLRAALAVFDSRRVMTDADTGDELVTVRFLRIETLLAEDLGAAEKLLRRSLESRSGQAVLPLELQDEIEKLFAQMAGPEGVPGPDDDEDQDQGDEGEEGDGDDDEPE